MHVAHYRFSLRLICLFTYFIFFEAGATPAFAPDSLRVSNPSNRAAPKSTSTRRFDGLAVPVPPNIQQSFAEEYRTEPTSEVSVMRQKIKATYDRVVSEDRFIRLLETGALLDLPMGIKTDLGVMKFVILLDSVESKPGESVLFASMVIENQHGKQVHFRGEVPFSPEGGFVGSGRLYLVGDYPIELDGGNSLLMIKGDRKLTFVEFDCNGYNRTSFDASVVFSRDRLIPEDVMGNELDGNVEISFTTTVTDWNDLIVDVSIPRFHLTQLPNVGFLVTGAALDFSDVRNPLAIKFPKEYEESSTALMPENRELWQGVYVHQVEVFLPPQFETKDEDGQKKEGTGHRISFRGTDLVIDHNGFSGRVSANNLIPIDKGALGNWNFSLESIHVNIVANQLVQGGFNGKIQIPIPQPQSDSPVNGNITPANLDGAGVAVAPVTGSEVFNYSAIISEGNGFQFVVSNATNLKFDLWKADLVLYPSSFVEVVVKNGKFMPKATLNGELSVKLGLGSGQPDADNGKNVVIPKVTFEKLVIQSVQPYITVGVFSLGVDGSSNGMGGFNFSINEISGSSEGDLVSLGFDVSLGLTGESGGAFGANGRFKIVAEHPEGSKKIDYRFKRLDIEQFGIDIDQGAFKFKGQLAFYKQDAIYGNGIKGSVAATFGPKFEMDANAIFGTKNGTRYWFVDALAHFGSGIPIFSGLALYSFGGGAYYKMKLSDKVVASPFGKTLSGMVYVPDESAGFGLKATVAIGLSPGQKSFNADATYEMAFHAGGGLKYINFSGNGYFLTTPVQVGNEWLIEKSKKIAAFSDKNGGEINTKPAIAEQLYGGDTAGKRAQVWARLMLNYDFDNKILHGNLNTFVNVAGGVIKGVGPNGSAGEAVIHFEQGKWYIYIGKPQRENRIAVEVARLTRLDAYFVMGTEIPGSPPPPANVARILQGIDPDYMSDLNALGGGGGVGFGASLSFDTGNLTFLIFYGRFEAGIGFDMMLRNYNITCEGSGPLGINGWYANGQAYAYMEGDIGIDTKVLKKNRKINILHFAAALLAQAKLPNPVWIKGVAGGNFSVLGGLVKGTCQFEVVIGEECNVIQQGTQPSVLESVDVVAKITPEGNAAEVDVFALPQAVFNYEVDRPYEMVDDNGQVVAFKIALDKFALKKGESLISADLTWNADKTVAALNPTEILPENSTLTLDVGVSFREKKGDYWVASQSEGSPVQETHQQQFATGKAPDYIPKNNVAVMYPLSNQANVYVSEQPTGYIKLKQWQPNLFAADGAWKRIARYTPSSGDAIEKNLAIDASKKEIRFEIPSSLGRGSIYSLGILKVPTTSGTIIDKNVSRKGEVVLASSAASVEVSERNATGSIAENQESTLFSSYFRTSLYGTFVEKVASVHLSSGWRWPVYPGIHALCSNISGAEPFASEETHWDWQSPLMRTAADLVNVPWYQNQIYPLLYDGYPFDGLILSKSNRDPDVLGIPPVRAVYVLQIPWDVMLTESQIAQGTAAFPPPTGTIQYHLPWFMYQDYLDLRNQAASRIANGRSSTRLVNLVTSTFPAVFSGPYPIQIYYVLPGSETPSSVYRHVINNPID